MAEKLTRDLNIIQSSEIEITVDPITADLNIIQKLDDEPNDVGGLSADQLKAKFDEAGNTIKTYINDSLIPQVLSEGITEAQREQNEVEREQNEEERQSAEDIRSMNELQRNRNDDAREDAETARQTAETARQTAESARVRAEDGRVRAEDGRVFGESERETAERARETAETARETAETARETAEMLRESAEESRDDQMGIWAMNQLQWGRNDSARESAEENRQLEEGMRQLEENRRASAERTRESAESERETAETARETAETARENAETAREAAQAAFFQGVSAEAVTLEPGAEATASAAPVGDSFRVTIGVPRGEPGPQGDVTMDQVNAAIDEALASGGDSGIPAGVICMFSGSIAPEGWAFCDGADGRPDLRGRFIIGADKATSDDPPPIEQSMFYSMGATGGEVNHTLSKSEMPLHWHSAGYNPDEYILVTEEPNIVNFMTGPSHQYSALATGDAKSLRDIQTTNAGNSEPHNNLPPYYALAYIIKL